MEQDIEQRVTVLAARQAHHHLVAVHDHAEIGDRLPGQPAQALRELPGLVRFLALPEAAGHYAYCGRFHMPIPKCVTCFSFFV